MATHTPGPWTVREWDRREVDVLGMGARIANVSAWADHDHTIADARLIAAAPEMLEALRKAREGYLATIEHTIAAVAIPSGYPAVSRAFADILSLVRHSAAEIGAAIAKATQP